MTREPRIKKASKHGGKMIGGAWYDDLWSGVKKGVSLPFEATGQLAEAALGGLLGSGNHPRKRYEGVRHREYAVAFNPYPNSPSIGICKF